MSCRAPPIGSSPQQDGRRRILDELTRSPPPTLSTYQAATALGMNPRSVSALITPRSSVLLLNPIVY